MDSKVLVLKSKITLASSLSQQILSEFNNDYFAIEENNVFVPEIDWFSKESFEEELDNLRVFAKRLKNKIKGDVLVYVKEQDNIYQGRYKVSQTKIDFEQCELNVNVKKEKAEKTKPLTESEKLDLFREYWDKKQEAPGKSEVYKGFRIGAFYTTMMKNQNTIEVMNQIMNESETTDRTVEEQAN